MGMSFMTIYLIGIALTALGAYVHSVGVRDDDVPAPNSELVLAVLAGLVWPIVLVGVAQFVAFIGIQRLARRFFPLAAPEETPCLDELSVKRSRHLVAV
jgi:hypothetical protein